MKCVNCSNEAEHQHHVVPKSIGGTFTVPLCIECHSKVHNKRMAGSYLTRLAKFKQDKELFARLLYLIVFKTSNRKEMVNDFNENGFKCTYQTISKLLNRMRRIETSDIKTVLNPIFNLTDEDWEWYIEEWDEFCNTGFANSKYYYHNQSRK